MLNNQVVLISGAGIGGLAAALALSNVGIPSVVLERAPELGEIGAGIQLGPNAFHSFDYLGIGDEARKIAVFVETIKVMDATTAEQVVSIPLDANFRTRFKNPYAVIHRGELHSLILRYCNASELITLRTNCEVRSYEQDEHGVTAFLATGEKVSGAALVGADGLRSNVRAQVIRDGEPRISGHTTYRSVIPTEQMPEQLRWNAMTIWIGPKCHMVHYPLSDWKAFNLVITSDNGAADPVAGVSASKEEVRRNFAHIHPTAVQIIEHGENWKYWVLCDREPVTNWRDGKVVLLGDAAHPMLQYMAQGACMALEDAVRLAHEVDRSSRDFEHAFEAYRLARIGRTGRVQTSARQMGELIFHQAGEGAKARNVKLSSMSLEDYYDAASWLYDGSGLSGVS
ncbi:3-hydroxybenzoate 6-monooxygenase [Rhizobium sp. P28RR-XV]|uniref:3-hydroxybenzoate 6-monooxygenase n=1 Tax=Rhizobium sp. P28RR-XV TaxID=2726737 RepID=UPI0014563C80|nr:3-hydroxybenzoate 6-monooxygenase [Rhizobium sp. P28RR-XV]NLR88187.1 3-hydroxybenzoate 6-monooxygenase [Rhizobium sp. P28RR-XV]